ncbi:ABC-2 family transporter [Brockia lithotrophica]|uniref:ABC-2 family transporter n=1 Tax=Brockia lithotrophica TaxID=933949 RepID=A0A660LAF2_9BACL|nr:ABC-2 family transporter [Brockia lithotrophica]
MAVPAHETVVYGRRVSFWALVQNELLKILRRKEILWFGLILLLVFGISFAWTWHTRSSARAEADSGLRYWEVKFEQSIEKTRQEYSREMGEKDLTPEQKAEAEAARDAAVAQIRAEKDRMLGAYREKGVSPATPLSVWWHVDTLWHATFGLLAFFVFAEGVMIQTSEFSDGTVRLLFAQPVSRTRIYFAKTISLLLYLAAALVLAALSLLVSFVFFPGESNAAILWSDRQGNVHVLPYDRALFRLMGTEVLGEIFFVFLGFSVGALLVKTVYAFAFTLLGIFGGKTAQGILFLTTVLLPGASGEKVPEIVRWVFRVSPLTYSGNLGPFLFRDLLSAGSSSLFSGGETVFTSQGGFAVSAGQMSQWGIESPPFLNSLSDAYLQVQVLGNISLWGGVGILLAWTVALWLLGYIAFVRREV